MSEVSFDCLSCGACCYSRHPRYLALLPEDAGRPIPDHGVFTEDERRFVRFECGRCVFLIEAAGARPCAIYGDRPEACRAFRAGSFECVKARRANGLLGEKVPPPADAGPVRAA